MKKLVLLFGLLLNTVTMAQSPVPTMLPIPPAPPAPPTQTQVMIMAPTLLRIAYGDSSLEMALTKNTNANSFKVGYTQTSYCPMAPQVAIQVRYEGNTNWYNTSVEQGVFRHGGFKLAAIKLLFRQTRYTSIDCEMYLTGAIDP